MASAPLQLLASDLSPSPARRLWTILRHSKGAVALGELFAVTEIEPQLFFSLIDNWSRRGLLLTQVDPLRFAMTEAAREKSVPPPLPRQPGRSVPKFSGRQRLWAAMRVLREFDLKTLCLAAEAGEKGAGEFMAALTRTGYVIALPARRGEATRFKLARNTGPKHPIVRRRNEGTRSIIEVDDRNDGELRTHTLDYAPRGLPGKARLVDGGVS